MPLIRPFAALRPVSNRAAEVIAPPYDVVTEDEARTRGANRPWDFLHVSRPEIDLPPGTDPHDAAVYARGAANLERMWAEGILKQDDSPCYYLYRLDANGHTQTGLAAVASVQAYDEDRIRRHELTRPDKEADRARQIDTLNAQTGPVFMTYRHATAMDEITADVVRGTPELDLAAPDGVRHTLWNVDDQAAIEPISNTFEAMDHLYIADGHHRSAAASRVTAIRRAANPQRTGEECYEYFLTVMFPDDQVHILDYNRVVADLNGLSTEAFLHRLNETFILHPVEQPVRPTVRGEFGMYLPGQWYRLALTEAQIPQQNPVARLEVSLLTDYILGPVLAIEDLRVDKRIDFVGGVRGLAALEEKVNSGRMAAAFSLHPTGIDDLLAVADAGLLMPPKSTWFEPKLADGLVSHVLE